METPAIERRHRLRTSVAFTLLCGLISAATVGCEKSQSASSEQAQRSASNSAPSTKESPGDEARSNPAKKPETSGEEADTGSGDAETSEKPELKPGTPKQKRLLAKAKKSFLTDDLEAAEPIFENVIESGPMTGTKASAYIALGQIYIESNQPQKAIDLLNTMPKPGNEIVEARMVLARAYAAAEEPREAIDAYEAVIELQPNYIFVYPTLGGLYNEVGEKKKAANLFLKYENKLESMSRALEKPESASLTNRINILDIFSAVRDERAVDAVEAALDDPSARVRSKAAKTAADIQAVGLKSTLEQMSKKDANKYVRRAAKSALKRLQKVQVPPDRPDDKQGFGER